jgi:hypothetical protein
MTLRILFLCFALLAYGLPAVADAEDLGQWVVVTAPDFLDALGPLIEHRRAEGFRVVVVKTTDVLSGDQINRGEATPLREHLQKLCSPVPQKSFILLVGAVTAPDPCTAEKSVVPPLPGTIGRMKGQPSDNGYGCLGEDLLPTVAVGRFPARSAKETESMVRKTLDLEKESPPAFWQNRLVMIVGNPGGSNWVEKRFAEWFVQMVGQSRLGQLHPSWSVRAIVHSPSSPFNVPGERLRDMTVRYLEEGAMFSFYLGHSGAYGLWSDGKYFLSRADWTQLNIAQGPGVFFTCGCFACQLRGKDGEGYGLTALRNPGGPAAVMGAHGESYAALGQLALDGMLPCLARSPTPTRLATFWLAAKAGLAQGEMNPVIFQMYDQADGSRGKIPLEVQRQEHLQMWILLGDPALRLPMQPLDIQLEMEGDTAWPGKPIHVKGTLPDLLARTNVRITLQRPPGSLPADLEATPDGPAAVRTRVILENHQRANNVILFTKEVTPRDKSFECEVELPFQVPWSTVVLRACSSPRTQAAQGLLVVPVRKEKN